VEVNTVAVVGAGTMGTGIAQVSCITGINVILADVTQAQADLGAAKIAANLDRLVAKQTIASADRDAALQRLTRGSGFDSLGSAEIVIEAVPEDPATKLRVVREIDAVAPEGAIIATNTSSISVTKLAAVTSRPDRFIGLHFFNPVPVMALVEVVRGLQTSDETHDEVHRLITRLGKTPINVKNSPGFVVNRILLPMLNEAFFVLAEGDAAAADIDDAMKLGCRHPMGPLALADLIGLDVLLSVMRTLHEEFGDPKYRPAPALGELVAAGYLGRKSGRGVYRY